MYRMKRGGPSTELETVEERSEKVMVANIEKD